jgi:hypothetical protein
MYVGTCALAVFAALAGVVANIYVGGGLVPDIGAVMFGGLVWLIGRTAKAALQWSVPMPKGPKDRSAKQK